MSTGWPRPTPGIDDDARAKLWRAACPDITDAELAAVDALLRAEPNNLRRVLAAYRAVPVATQEAGD